VLNIIINEKKTFTITAVVDDVEYKKVITKDNSVNNPPVYNLENRFSFLSFVEPFEFFFGLSNKSTTNIKIANKMMEINFIIYEALFGSFKYKIFGAIL
jgi:hypothetical protein